MPRRPLIGVTTDYNDALTQYGSPYAYCKAVEKAGWVTPPNHPDLVPTAEVARMTDLLRIQADSDRAKSKPAEFAVLRRLEEANWHLRRLGDAVALALDLHRDRSTL